MLMVQSNAQVPMKNAKLKGPPPVPPRPNQSVVAEALAKTRKAVAESRANLTKSRTITKQVVKETPTKTSKAKTLERTLSLEQPAAAAPKQNGLARVKSFIRDVISDRSSSSDERKSSGQNSRRSSSDSSSIPGSINSKKSNESLNAKAVKTCKQILVRSLSTSNKLEQDNKCKVIKSSSFAEKTLPLRKAPPPPLSPKPKIRPMKPLPVHRQSLERIDKSRKPESFDFSPYSTPVDAKKPPKSPVLESVATSTYSAPIDAKRCDAIVSEAPYATVEEVQEFDDRLRDSPDKNLPDVDHTCNGDVSTPPTPSNEISNCSSLERKTSRVTERLISEILAGRNKTDANAVIDKGKDEPSETNDCDESLEIRKDMNNHEMLIYELQIMRSQTNVPESLEAQSPSEPNDNFSSVSSEDCPPSPVPSVNIQEDVDYTNIYACVIDDDLKSRLRKQFRAISNMSLQGLPPLPKSLSGFADGRESGQESNISSPTTPEQIKPPTDLDSQLDYLKKEMASLRQLDLSLLSELWALSEAMSSWRRQLERAPRLRPAPPPPPPPPPPHHTHYLRT